MFWPTFTCQILIKFSFLESLWPKEADCTSFAKKKLQIVCKQPVKGNLHIFSFSWLKIRLFKILLNFLHIWNGMVKGFSKMCITSYFGQFIFCKHFSNITGFCKKEFNFCKFAIFSDSISRTQELSNDVSFVHLSYLDLKHGIFFKYPSRDRVKNYRWQGRMRLLSVRNLRKYINQWDQILENISTNGTL